MDTYSIMVFNYLLPTRVSLDNVYTLDQFINKIKLNDEFRNIIHNIDPYLVPYINDFDIILRKPNHSTSLDYNDPLHRLLIIDMYYNDDYININHLNEIRDIEFFLPLKINIINYSDNKNQKMRREMTSRSPIKMRLLHLLMNQANPQKQPLKS